jgi:hypothetical protein
MTIDERLERLTERHEALTQSVELMAAENRGRDEKADARMGKLISLIEKLAGSVDKVAQIAANHEHRIDRLEG